MGCGIAMKRTERITGGRVLLRQSGLLLTDTWRMDAGIGHYRALTPQLLSAGYRFYLPSSLVQGASASWYDQATRLSISAGELGRLNGTSTYGFETTGGRLMGAAITHDFNDRLQAGVQFWHTGDIEEEQDHEAYVSALRYASPDLSQGHQGHLMVDSDNRMGLWYDGEFAFAPWTHRLGAFYFEPDLQWTDVAIINDLVGAYWRSDFRSFRWRWTVGAELSRDNLENDVDLPGYSYTNAFANTAWRMRRSLVLGASLGWATRDADSGTAQTDSRTTTLSSYISHPLLAGTSRFEASLERHDTGDTATSDYGLLWDLTWKVPYLKRLRTAVEHRVFGAGANETSLRIDLSKSLFNDLAVNGSAQYYRRWEDADTPPVTVYAALGLDWRISQRWTLNFTADMDVADPGEDDAEDTFADNQRLLLSLSYAFEGKSPSNMILGRQTGTQGSGSIVGRVFLDENQNNRYDLNETPLPNIVVILDGRFQTETDADGRYSFVPVSSGSHSVSIAIQDVPLPWGLADQKPVPVVVPIRGQAEVDFALTRWNE